MTDLMPHVDSTRQRRSRALEAEWDGRVESWNDQVRSGPGFDLVRSELLTAAAARPSDVVLDLGAGVGFITLPVARAARTVTAVDVSPRMLEALRSETRRLGLRNVITLAGDMSRIEGPEHCVDLIVSCYALHHLTRQEKLELLNDMAYWLRPGGRVVIADMMFGRGLSDRDRTIAKSKIRVLARRGPAGWWRICRNLVRFGLRIGHDRPETPEFWQDRLRAAGFKDVTYQPLVAEAGLITGRLAPTAPDLRLPEGSPAQPSPIGRQTARNRRSHRDYATVR